MKKIFFFLCTVALFKCAIAQQKFTLDGNQLVLPTAIEFETGSDKIKPQSMDALMHIKAYLEEKTYISMLRIEVHTDNAGNAASGQALTEKRALAIGRWLVSKGIDCTRLVCVGFGGTKPVADNATPDGQALNRRVSVVNAGLRGRMIGGMPADGGGVVAGDVCK